MKKQSKRFKKLKELVDPIKLYNLDEALDLIEQTSTTKFDESVEVHIRLGINTKKSEENVRGVVVLPNGTGKTIKVAVFTNNKQKEAKDAGADLIGGSDLIQEIKKTGKCDADVSVAEPDIMKELAGIAKILGPRGLMPSPKNDTVTANIKSAVLNLKKGKVDYKNDDSGNIHQAIGKVSFGKDKLKKNYEVFIESVKTNKPESFKKSYIKGMALSTTMGLGIKLAF